jgi:hypothetical protein
VLKRAPVLCGSLTATASCEMPGAPYFSFCALPLASLYECYLTEPVKVRLRQIETGLITLPSMRLTESPDATGGDRVIFHRSFPTAVQTNSQASIARSEAALGCHLNFIAWK